MPKPIQNTAVRIEATKHAAAAFVEDMEHMRELLTRRDVGPTAIRHLSVPLRRLLVDNELRAIAPPRIGALQLSAPDNSPIYRAARHQTLTAFASGGPKVFGRAHRGLTMGRGSDFVHDEDYDPDREVALSLDGFLSQRVLALHGDFVSRRNVIKYVANVVGGAHSRSAKDDYELLLDRLRSLVRMSADEDGGMKAVFDLHAALVASETPFKWTAQAIDVVLVEVLAAAHYLAISPDVQRLEAFIREELAK